MHSDSWRVHLFGRESRVQIVLVAGFACMAGCADSHIKSIEDGRAVAYHVHKLSSYPDDEAATRALIQAMKDDRPDVRFFAAEALFEHLKRPRSSELRQAALLGLVHLLEDQRIGRTSLPVCGPLLPGVSGVTGSVRARALLTLTQLTGEDFGFNQKEWLAFLDHRHEA